MAYAHYGTRATVPAAATSLTSLFGLSPTTGRMFRVASIRSDSANAARIYFGPTSAVTAAGVAASGYLAAGDGYTIDLHAGGLAHTNDWFIIGNGTDVIYGDFYE